MYKSAKVISSNVNRKSVFIKVFFIVYLGSNHDFCHCDQFIVAKVDMFTHWIKVPLFLGK